MQAPGHLLLPLALLVALALVALALLVALVALTLLVTLLAALEVHQLRKRVRHSIRTLYLPWYAIGGRPGG